MVSTGYKQSVYFGNETTYGSAVTVDQPIGLVQSINPTETNNLIKVRTLGGTRDYNNIVPGKFEVSGSFEYYLQNGAFLRMALGEDTSSTATVDSGPSYHTGDSTTGYAYLHCMGSAASPLANSFPSFTLEFADDESTVGTYNLNRTYTGCRVNSLALNGTVDEPLRVSTDWIAQGVTISTAGATAVVDATSDPYVFYQGVVYSTSGTITSATVIEDASRLCEVNSFDFSVGNNLEATWYISGTCGSHETKRGLKGLIPKGRDYEASLNLHFADKAMYQRFLGSSSATGPQDTLTDYSVVLDFVRSGSVGGTKTITDDFIRIVLNDCKFADMNIPGGPEDIVTETIGVAVEAAKIYVVDADATYKS